MPSGRKRAEVVPGVTKVVDPAARIDRWLWTVRLFKTRGLATDACRGGSVIINERESKPGRDVHPGETVMVKQGLVTRTVRVVGVPPARVGPKLVANFYTDLTPASEFEKAREHRVQHLLAREQGSGRPTKRDRRLLDRLFEI